MHKPIRKSYLMIIIVGALLPLLFNACGGPNGLHGLNESLSLSSTGIMQKKLCETAFIANYATTYHPLMRTSCNQCHSNAHGSNDVRLSYNAFQAKGQNLIDFQATTPHGGNNINLTAEIAAVQQPWADANTAYSECLAANPDEVSESGLPFNVRQKALAGINGNFREYEWDLYVDSGDRAGQIRAMFRIEARLYSYQGAVVGYEFRNPSIQLVAGQPAVQLDGIRITANGQLLDSATTYTSVSAAVSDTTKTMIAMNLGNALVYVNGASATQPVGFQFLNLK